MNHKIIIKHLFHSSPFGGIEWGLAFILALSALQAQAGDSILHDKAQLLSPRLKMQQEEFRSPALRNLLRVPSLSDIALSATSMPAATARIPQLGSGGRDFRVDAESFQRLGKNSLVWGNASYENGRKYDVRWNESSDFLQLFPYVMADAKGGDMKYEEYRLNGGFSSRHNRILYGVEMGYRALSEYRDRDPRPNNTVADLYASAGFGLAVSGDYALAVNVDAGKYKQTNELAFFNELGAQKVFQLTGLGNDFARFSGSCNNSFFKGYSLGAGLALAPVGGYGWMASANYSFVRREKILTDLNRLPLNRLNANRISASAAFSMPVYGFRLKGEHVSRKGFDNLFGDPSGSTYPQIGTREEYSGTATRVLADGYWSITMPSGTTVDLEPQVQYSSFSNSHKGSGNRFDSDDLLAGFRLGIRHIFGKNMIGAKANASHRFNIKQHTAIFGSCDESLKSALLTTAEYFKKGETSFGISAEYTRRIWGNKALSLGAEWQHGMYLAGESDNRYEAKISFTI